MKVAIIPSNQDHNITRDGSNEMEQVASFSEIFMLEAPSKYTARLFVPNPESQDTYKYENLYNVQKTANEWKPDLAVNFHSDSGHFTHVGAYHDGSKVGTLLCSRLAPKLHDIFGGIIMGGNYSDFIFATHMDAPAVLLELGSHELIEDITTLSTNAKPIAQAIWSVISTMLVSDDMLKHLDFLWASANQMKTTAQNLSQVAEALTKEVHNLNESANASYERIIAIKSELGL